MLRPPPSSTLFPYTTLFRSHLRRRRRGAFLLQQVGARHQPGRGRDAGRPVQGADQDRKSTRLNSSHMSISYAVFCLKKKKKDKNSCNDVRTSGSGRAREDGL